MTYPVVTAGLLSTITAPPAYILVSELEWNDYWEFKPLFSAALIVNGKRTNLGSTKILEVGLQHTDEPNGIRTPIPRNEAGLPDSFYSLGQDIEYYERIASLGDDVRVRVLSSLKDIAFLPEVRTVVRTEPAYSRSLTRYVTEQAITKEFAPIALGNAVQTPYEFTYTQQGSKRRTRFSLTFSVTPNHLPPRNVNILVGRNGVGKTTILSNLAAAVIGDPLNDEFAGQIEWADSENSTQFDSVVSVSFSLFDDFVSLKSKNEQETKYHYIGLKMRYGQDENDPYMNRELDDLVDYFVKSVKSIRTSGMFSRWQASLENLQADPIFAAIGIVDAAERYLKPDQNISELKTIYKKLSSGHKIVLLTLTKLVEVVRERSLVLLDEPECHLHPPLLSAFTRSLSTMLARRNAVAIVATHSPVVLQEVPRDCVWKIYRTGALTQADRPSVETFGEAVGQLTSEVFELEVEETGFHKLIRDLVAEGLSYEEIVEKLNNEVGSEARTVAKALTMLARVRRQTVEQG